MLSAQKLVSWLPHKLIALAAVAGLMAGLVTTRVVLSVATITLACNALLHEHVRAHFRLWLKNRNAMLFLGYFLICALSGFYSENLHAWWSSTQNKLPLLAIPFGWTVIHKDLQAYGRALLYAFVMIISVAAAAVLINYFLHYETLNASIKLGSAIPTPMMDHIRFSLETALAALLCLHLLLTGKQFRWLLVLLFLLLGTTLHFLAVRSGLLAFYGGLLLMGLYQLFSGRNRKLGTITLLAGIVIGVMALRFIPSLHNKVLYFNYEWSLIEQGELKAGHSDAQRVQSILYGWEVARQNFPLGVGTGDLRDVMDAEYLQHPDTASIKPERPHNQFVYTLAAIGLAGFVLLLLAFFYPLSDKTSMKAWLMPAYLFIVLISFMTEHVLEIQIGMAFIMLFNHLLPEAFRKKGDNLVKKISAIVTCGNEAAHIQGVLESLSWCDECIVVDSYSEDGTPEIASRFTDKVWQRAYVSPADQKNWAIPQASHEWVLILDADERVTPALEQEIRDLLHANTIPYVAYRIFRINYFMGKRIRFSGWQHDAVVRFFHRDHGRYPDQMVHEELVADGPVGTLKGKLLHFTFKDREHYLQKIDRYARWSALDKESSTGRITWFHTLLKPAFRFVKHFILQGGVLDGYAGWVIATTNARGVALRYRYMLANRNATTS